MKSLQQRDVTRLNGFRRFVNRRFVEEEFPRSDWLKCCVGLDWGLVNRGLGLHY